MGIRDSTETSLSRQPPVFIVHHQWYLEGVKVDPVKHADVGGVLVTPRALLGKKYLRPNAPTIVKYRYYPNASVGPQLVVAKKIISVDLAKIPARKQGSLEGPTA